MGAGEKLFRAQEEVFEAWWKNEGIKALSSSLSTESNITDVVKSVCKQSWVMALEFLVDSMITYRRKRG